jgi:acetyl esterase/lipase
VQEDEEATMEPRDILTRPASPPDVVLRYGPGPDHVADLRLPAAAWPGQAADRGLAASRPGQAAAAPLVIFLHGGFWRAAYDRTHTGPLAIALAAEGFAVCAPEYRRTGQAGGGWPGTFDDVATAVDAIPALAAEAADGRVDPDRPLLAGHSAGGHLALWAASRHRLPPGTPWAMPASRFRGVVALAAVSDLILAHRQGLGNDAVAALMGGGPDARPRRFDLADPAGLLPVGTPVRLVHGQDDDIVPCNMSLDYAARARAAGDDAACAALPGVEHFALIDPLSRAWPEVAGAFQALCPSAGPLSAGPATA